MSVKAWRDEIPLKTYLLGPENPNPPWQRTGRTRVYPYPMQDDLTDAVEVVSYEALHIENEHLHCIVLPELGGHLYSLYDKVADREVFYRNNVVKYGLVARRGAWISGGIEFNFPQGHTCVTVSPVQSATIEETKVGRAAIVIGYTDRVSRMRCSVTLSLARGEARLRQDVMLHNPRPVRQRHYFWANSAVPARDDLHMIYPCARARTLGGEWPYPVVEGRDMSWYRNHERPNDIFALDVTDDFFGCYYAEEDVGLVHWSDHRLNCGKKFFTWGTADEGMIWVDLLTDDDGQYVELQSGRFVDQSTFEFLFPYQTARWTEYWYPVSGMGGFVCATDEAALDLQFEGNTARVAAMLNCPGRPGELALEIGGRKVWREAVELRAGESFRREVTLAEPHAEAEVSLVFRESGGEVIRYDHPPAYLKGRPLELKAPPPRKADDLDATPEELCSHAIRHEMWTDFDAARGLYDRALEQDAGHSQAHLGLGILDYSAGLLEAARDHLDAAVRRDPENDEAWYYLAVVLIEQGNEAHAADVLWRLVGRSACRTEAAIALAKLALRRGEPWEALGLLDKVEEGPTALFLRAVALRLAKIDCHRTVVDARDADPLAAELQAELHFGASRPRDKGIAIAAFEGLVDLLGDDPELWLELAFRYWDLRRPDEAARLLKGACDSPARVREAPMPHYVLAALQREMGDDPEPERLAAAACDPAYCFPSRLEELPALQWAAEEGECEDWKAMLYLGNLLASLGRREEAWHVWLRAASWVDDAAICRNVALGFSLLEEDHGSAWANYNVAIRLRPDDYHLYVERDRALVADGVGPAERLAAFESAPEGVLRRWEVAAIRVNCLVELEQWDEAVSLMQSHSFRPWEGARAMHSLWAQALLGRAAGRREGGNLTGAIADYELALTYPRNLGVGQASRPQEAKVHWLLAETAGEAGEEATRERHLLAAAEEKHTRICEADLYTARALTALGRTDEAGELREKVRAWASNTLESSPEHGAAKRVLDELQGDVSS